MNTTRTEHEHAVGNGRVWCAKLLRDVSVETCWMCERLEGFEIDGDREVVRCVPIGKAGTPVLAGV